MPILAPPRPCAVPWLNEHQPGQEDSAPLICILNSARFTAKTHNELATHEVAPMSESAVNQQS